MDFKPTSDIIVLQEYIFTTCTVFQRCIYTICSLFLCNAPSSQSRRIRDLTAHLQDHRHDHATRRGLLILVEQRRRLLRYSQADESDLDLVGAGSRNAIVMNAIVMVQAGAREVDESARRQALKGRAGGPTTTTSRRTPSVRRALT